MKAFLRGFCEGFGVMIFAALAGFLLSLPFWYHN